MTLASNCISTVQVSRRTVLDGTKFVASARPLSLSASHNHRNTGTDFTRRVTYLEEVDPFRRIRLVDKDRLVLSTRE